MAVVTPDLVSGHALNEVLGGFDVVQVFRVTELVAAPHLQLIEAAQDPGIPGLNEAYDPAWPKLLCVNRDFSPDGCNAARAEITFSTQRNVSTWNQPDPPTNDGQDVKQITASTKAIRTVKDRTGAPLTIVSPPTLDTYPNYLSEAEVLVPIGQITFERVEQSPPTARMRAMLGSVNQFALGAGIYPVNSLLFRDLSSISDDGGNTWRVTYVFDYDSDLHRHADRYHGPDGKVPTDAVELVADVLTQADFTSLGLDFSDSQTPIG